jgi:hypothetical protein
MRAGAKASPNSGTLPLAHCAQVCEDMAGAGLATGADISRSR